MSDAKLPESPTFCVLPWLHMATYTNGAALLCCVAKDRLGLNLNKTTLQDAWNSPVMRGVRRQMLDGQKVSACEFCYTEERNGARSHRQAEGVAWQERFGTDFIRERVDATLADGTLANGMVALDLRLGNTCNLQCVMCRPQDSSRWVKLGEKLAKEAKNPDLKADWGSRGRIDLTRFAWYQSPEFLNSLRSIVPDLRELIIGGGEPMLLEEHDHLLDMCLEEDAASHIQLRYHSNGTRLDSEIFEKWKRFKLVEFFVSVDGVGAKNEYFRHPCNWETLTANLRALDNYPHGNLRVIVLASVHVLNFYYLTELGQWIEEQKFKLVGKGFAGHFLPGIVHHPNYLSVQLYPPEVKTWIEAQVASFERSSQKPMRKMGGVVNFMKEREGAHLLPALREYLLRLDASRGTRFDQVFPELNYHLKVY